MEDFKDKLTILNMWAAQFFSGNLMDTFYPVKFCASESITILNKDDASTLNDLVGGAVKVYHREGNLDNSLMCRQLISYTMLNNMLEKKNLFYYTMSLTINSALVSLTNIGGNLQGRHVTAERPGQPGVFFHESQNHAGVEFRVFVK